MDSGSHEKGWSQTENERWKVYILKLYHLGGETHCHNPDYAIIFYLFEFGWMSIFLLKH